MVRIIIAGGREFNDYELLKQSVNDIIFDLECRNTITGIGNASRVNEKHLIEFISGTARGADQLGELYAERTGLHTYRFPADWDGLGKRAGYMRNAEMAKFAVKDGNYAVLVAFWDGKSKGTKHMIDLANNHGLEVHVVNYKEKTNENN